MACDHDICALIDELINYAVSSKLTDELDRTWAVNSLLQALELHDYESSSAAARRSDPRELHLIL